MVALQARFTVEPALIFERSDFGDTPDMSVARECVRCKETHVEQLDFN